MSDQATSIKSEPVVHRDVKARRVDGGIVVYIPESVQHFCGINVRPERVYLCSDKNLMPGSVIIMPVDE